MSKQKQRKQTYKPKNNIKAYANLIKELNEPKKTLL